MKKNTINESYYEKKNGKYYIYDNGIRFRVTKETWLQSQEEDRQERIRKMNHGEDFVDKETLFYESKKLQTIKLNENQLRNIVAESVKKVLKEEYGNDNEMWNMAKQMLDPQVMLEALEGYLDRDGLLDEYAARLSQDYDLRTYYSEQL